MFDEEILENIFMIMVILMGFMVCFLLAVVAISFAYELLQKVGVF